MYTEESDKISTEDILQHCTKMIQKQDIVAGVGNRIVAPLVSLFLGKEAEDNEQHVRDVYFSSWSSKAAQMVSLSGPYDLDEFQTACAAAQNHAQHAGCLDRSQLNLVWYWDIMDERFDTFFQCVNQPFVLPLGCTCTKYYFIFCRQTTPEEQQRTQERLDQLTAWADQTNRTLIILSNQSAGAILHGAAVCENYHLAATIAMLANTRSVTESFEAQIARDLAFSLQSARLWTAGYSIGTKPYSDIINVSLMRIIEKGCGMFNQKSNTHSLQDALCGFGHDYIDFLDEVFHEILEPRCPTEEQRIFWEDLPRTQDMEALCTRLAEGPQRRLRLGDLFRARKGSWENAVASLGGFWDCCVRKYYTGPITDFLEYEDGLQRVAEAISHRIAQKCSLRDMAQLHEEAVKLRTEDRYQHLQLNTAIPKAGDSLCGYLHNCACISVKEAIYPKLIPALADAMDQMCSNAKDFEPLVKTVFESYQSIANEKQILDSYGEYMKRLLEDNEQLFRQMFLPCSDESELLLQMEQIFQEMVNYDKLHEQRYFASLQDHIRYLMDSGTPNADEVISSCIHTNLKKLGRLTTFSQNPGTFYCIMDKSMTQLLNDAVADGINSQQIGQQFVISRSDRIERLYLYSLESGSIQFTNAPHANLFYKED